MQDIVSPALVIDPTPFLSNIVRYCLSEDQAEDLALDDQFMNARYRVHQFVRLFEFASTQLHIELLVRAVAQAFEVSRTAVARAEMRCHDDSLARWRYRKLSADYEQKLVEWLAKKAANHKAMNRTGLLHECTE
jgi:hypothetical protein